MWRIAAILLISCTFSSLANDTLWVDDKSQQDLYNCEGHVTDAVCCQDKLCDGQSESSCLSDDKRKLFCNWDSSRGKCLEVRDVENNVCCQKPPLTGCSDIMAGRCPDEFQVPEGCCTADGQKWNSMLKGGVPPGKVCCNAPCKDADAKQCSQHGKCMTKSYFGSSYINPNDYGIAANFIHHKHQYGNYYQSLAPYSNADQLDNYKTKEVTVDDIVEMLVEALENDDDIVQSDKTLHATPFGQSKVFNHWPMNTNYIQPNLILAKLLSPFGLQGYGPYGQNYGYNQGYGYNTGHYAPNYNQGYAPSFNQGYAPSYNQGYPPSYNLGYPQHQQNYNQEST